MSREIKKQIPLLRSDGHLMQKGYAKRMNFVYNREAVRHPWMLKEWNFYQFIREPYVLQLTIGHLTYMCSVTATLIELNTGRKWEINSMKPFFVPHLDRNPEEESMCVFRDEHLSMVFRVTKRKRILTVKGLSPSCGPVNIRIEAENDVNNEKMVIATPFDKTEQFYLNYKENYYHASGYAAFGKKRVDLDGSTGLIDWGRGIWPYSHEWYWGSLTSQIDSIPFGFNIGWGFGDLTHATENMFFYNRKAYKLGRLLVTQEGSDPFIRVRERLSRDGSGYRYDRNGRKVLRREQKKNQSSPADRIRPWKLQDEYGRMKLTFTPTYDNYTQNRYIVIDTHCDQVYGWFDGVIETENGHIEFRHKRGFIEHAVNRW